MGRIRDNVRRNGRWFGQEGAQEANRGQLQAEAELVVCATPHVETLTVGIIEVEVAGKLLVGWRPNKVAVRLLWASVRNSPGIGAEAYAVTDSPAQTASLAATT
ncbi:MAG TPA: hypothetical protein VGK33_11585 [Chloroflexota bacterium]